MNSGLLGTKGCFNYISLLSSLKAMLKDKSVLEQVQSISSRVQTDGIMTDFCDG